MTQVLTDRYKFISSTLGIPPIRKVKCVPQFDEKRGSYKEYLLGLEDMRVIHLGEAKDVLSFSKCQAAIAEATGIVISLDEKRTWADAGGMASMLFAAANEEGGDE